MIIIDSTINILWIFVSLLFIFLGIYFTFKLHGIQFNIIKMFKGLFNNNKKVLMLSLGGRIGVGSIAGIALAIYLGGIGTLFWIFLISVISMPFVYSEVYLGIKYKMGPFGYIKYSLNKYFGIIYLIVIIICYIFGFISIQANTIVKSINSVLYIPPYIIGIILSFISLIIIFGGIKKISNTLDKIVPFMMILYILIGLIVFIKNINIVVSIFRLIVKSAFNIKSFLIGIERGIFSTEAGIGTGSIASSIGNNSDSRGLGYVQMLGVYITVFLICFSSAIIIVTSNYGVNIIDPNGIEIALSSFTYHFGYFGNIILIILIVLFAISSILSSYYYGEVCFKYLFNNKYSFFVKIITIMMVFIGSINSATLLWKMADIFIAILAIINIYAIFMLRDKIKT